MYKSKKAHKYKCTQIDHAEWIRVLKESRKAFVHLQWGAIVGSLYRTWPDVLKKKNQLSFVVLPNTRGDFGGKIGIEANERLTKLDSQNIKSGQPSLIGELSCEVTEVFSSNHCESNNCESNHSESNHWERVTLHSYNVQKKFHSHWTCSRV